MENRTLHINLHLGAHTIALNNVPAEQESFYRNAQVTLNQAYEHFRSTQPKASVEQLWMYVALQAAVNLHSDARAKSLEPIDEKIKELNKLIQEQL